MILDEWILVCLALCAIHMEVTETSQCCEVSPQRLIQTEWQRLMLALDTRHKQQAVADVVAGLEASGRHRAAAVLRGRVALDPALQAAGPRHSYTETLRQVTTLLGLLDNVEALDRQLTHYVLHNHVAPSEMADDVADGLTELISKFLELTDLDPSQWQSCVEDMARRLRTTAARVQFLYARCDIRADAEAPAQPIHGTITFQQPVSASSTIIQGTIFGFDKDDDERLHGFHIHTSGELGNDCKDAGGHYNPEQLPHGGPTHVLRHVGDLGNIAEDEEGSADVLKWDRKVELSGERSVINRSIVVHATVDDLGTGGYPDGKKTGHAGARLGCCVIQQVPEPSKS